MKAESKKEKYVPFYTKLNPALKKAILRHPSLSPMAALNLAAIKIQKIFKGFVIRKNKKQLKKYLEDKAKLKALKEENKKSSSQRLKAKFARTKKHFKAKSENDGFEAFCATKIAATFRMSLVRRLFKFYNFSIYHIASYQIQQAWKRHSSARRKPVPYSKEETAAHKIQM
eukprot:TRINITY_DN13677_c0_g1_i13.p1 TRINITY_DN13677_c0_g1~~TRINITY_DN13677_c0_g1_i13.p1  ORF type:complete len:171 (+),score=56.67 TRINITY_DN13677_c0_g1_i13:75-587(+)